MELSSIFPLYLLFLLFQPRKISCDDVAQLLGSYLGILWNDWLVVVKISLEAFFVLFKDLCSNPFYKLRLDASHAWQELKHV